MVAAGNAVNDGVTRPRYEPYLQAAAEKRDEIVAATATHIHADFLSGSRELAERYRGPGCISR